MDNIKKNPLLMGVLNAVGAAAALLLVEFVISLFSKTKSFADQISDPFTIVLLIVGPIACGVSAYMKTKKDLSGKQEE